MFNNCAQDNPVPSSTDVPSTKLPSASQSRTKQVSISPKPLKKIYVKSGDLSYKVSRDVTSHYTEQSFLT